MKKIFTLFVATATLLSVQAAGLERARIANVPFGPAARTQAAVEAANANGTNFTLSASDVDEVSAIVSIVPNDAAATYMFNAVEAEYFDQITPASYTAYLKDYIDQEYGIYIQMGYATYDNFLLHGERQDTLRGLTPDTEYVIVAWGIDATTFTATTAFDTLHIHTAAGQMSDNVITMAHANGKINVTTTNDDPYFFIIESLAAYQEYEDDFTQASLRDEIADWASSINNQGYLSYFIYSGSQSIDAQQFYTTLMAQTMPAGDYVALAAGYTEYVTTDAAYVQFTYGNTPVENVKADSKAVKAIRNGQVVILRNGVEYNLLGAEVK